MFNDKMEIYSFIFDGTACILHEVILFLETEVSIIFSVSEDFWVRLDVCLIIKINKSNLTAGAVQVWVRRKSLGGSLTTSRLPRLHG